MSFRYIKVIYSLEKRAYWFEEEAERLEELRVMFIRSLEAMTTRSCYALREQLLKVEGNRWWSPLGLLGTQKGGVQLCNIELAQTTTIKSLNVHNTSYCLKQKRKKKVSFREL